MLGPDNEAKIGQGAENDDIPGPREGQSLEDWVAEKSKKLAMEDWDPRDLGC